MLFLDEPTSGLDSFAATLLINTVHQIVKERQISCLMTIHQPSWAMFTKLDRVILLAKDGVYYDGPPREAVQWFECLGFKVPEGVNPADYFISIAETEAVSVLSASWKSRDKDGSSSSLEGSTVSITSRVAYPTTLVKEFSILYARWWRETVRSRMIQLISVPR
jgi:ABC-type multidrug transport system ATPase subunit